MRITATMQRRRELLAARQRASISLRLMRHELGWSKSEMARICCVGRCTVDRWEDPASASTPDAAHLGAICAAAGEAAGAWVPRIIGLPWID